MISSISFTEIAPLMLPSSILKGLSSEIIKVPFFPPPSSNGIMSFSLYQLYFSFDTKMDDFHVGPVALSGEVGYSGEYENPAEALKEDFKRIGAQFEAFGKKLYRDGIEKEYKTKAVSEEQEILAE